MTPEKEGVRIGGLQHVGVWKQVSLGGEGTDDDFEIWKVTVTVYVSELNLFTYLRVACEKTLSLPWDCRGGVFAGLSQSLSWVIP